MTRNKRGRSEELSDDGYNVYATDLLRENITHMKRNAIRSNYIIELISENKADPNVKDEWGRTPLMVLCVVGQTARDGFFYDAIMKVFSFLLNLPTIDANVGDQDGERAIDYAVRMSNPSFLELLLLNRLVLQNINTLDPRGYSALHIATLRHTTSTKIIRVLLENGADPLLKTGSGAGTAFHLLLANMRDLRVLTTILHLFFEHGARLDEPNYCDNKGRSVLHLAAILVNNQYIFTLLLHHSKSQIFHLQDSFGKTAEEYALYYKNAGVLAAIKLYKGY